MTSSESNNQSGLRERRESAITEVGEYDWGNKEGVSVDHGKYIVVYLKVGGRWKLHRDMFTSSVPPKK